jgi:serine/threonine protein kinase
MNTDRWSRIKATFQAALDGDPADREPRLAAACGTDADLREAVDRLLAAHSGASGFLESAYLVDPALLDGVPPVDDAAPSQIGPYRVIRELGRGGMGTVYLAERDYPSLRRTVAIKVVNVASRSVLKRFRTEADVLASLEHPGIARLYDAGATESGVPYLVMEFVPGDDLLRYSDAGRASLNERLRLFHRVCEAVQYAHQNFIVHRDLKPSNILVTPEGDPKLLDFGVAKLLSADDGADETALFGAMLTPQYSSPEHVRGERITTASDVYSLGVVLYELLCGSRPYHIATRTPSEIERTISGQEPKPPSAAVDNAGAAAARGTDADRLRRQLRGDLDNIVHKAMRKEPAERYATAAELAADLERYLRGYPVAAQPGSASYRATKFLRRHRRSAAVVTLATLALIVGLAVALWEGHLARVARDRADHRFKDVQRLANALIFKIHDGVEALPNSTPVRRMIIAEALSYLEALRNDPAADESLRIDLAQAYQRIGVVQGQGTVANLGDRAGAIDSFSKGMEVLRPLMADPPAHPRAAVLFGRTALSLASTALSSGDNARAQVAVRDAERVAAPLAAAPSADDDAKRLIASVHFEYAILTSGQEALSHWKTAGDIFGSLLAARPDDDDRQRNVALVQKYLASFYDSAGDYPAALEHDTRARDLDEKRLARNPADRRVQIDVATDLANTAHIQWVTGRLQDAVASFERSLAIRQQLADSDPHDTFAPGRVAYVHTRLADLYAETGNVTASLAHARKAVTISEAVGHDAAQRSALAEARVTLGEAEGRAGAVAEACRQYRQANAAFAQLAGQKLTGRQKDDRSQLLERLERDLRACQSH